MPYVYSTLYTYIERAIYIAILKNIFYIFIIHYRKSYDTSATCINVYIYVSFADNQLINCRNHILEFKENMLRLKNKTETNRQELMKTLNRMKDEIEQRENLSARLGLCCFCFCVW